MSGSGVDITAKGNMQITKIGMCVAMDKEVTPFLKKQASDITTETVGAFKIYSFKIKNKSVYLVRSGIGEIYAAAAAQTLIVKYGVEVILNFGVCGSLVKSVAVFDAVLVDSVVHYDFDLSTIDGVPVGQYPGFDSPVMKTDESLIKLAESLAPIKKVTCASADKFVADPKIKAELHQKFGASVCDMECAAVFLTASGAGVPVLIIKAVSDGEGGADEFKRRVESAEKVYIDTVDALIEKL